MPTSVTCYGGVNEIGGNKILIADGSSRFLFDFGTAFGRWCKFFNEFLRPRASRGLLDPISLGLIPPLRGIYRRDLEIPKMWDQLPLTVRSRIGTLSDIDAVFFSHAHLDHTGDASFLDETIPFYCTRTTAAINRAMQVTGISSMEREMAYINPRIDKGGVLGTGEAYRLRPYFFLDGNLDPAGKSFWETAGGSARKGITNAECDSFSGTLSGHAIRWWPVDHSLPGAVAFAIETEIGWIVYSGDIRFHGFNGEWTKRFQEETAALNPQLLICEGTHLEPSRERTTEANILDRAIDIISLYPGKLAIADFGPRNVERLLIFLQIARETNRRLVLQPKDIYLLRSLHLMNPEIHHSPEDLTPLAMFDDPKSAPRGWELEIRGDWPSRLTFSSIQISESPGEFILADSLWDLNDLVDLKNIEGGAYLFSNSRAYDDEQAADLERLRNWVKWIGLDLFGDPEDPKAIPLHASGHASGEELETFVKRIRPKHFLPVHTENAAWWMVALKGTDIVLHMPEEAIANKF